ncbi:MAG: GNAT family N-acetyltransferase [Clostridium sp.]|nr:GNAT family N-acetyltransferase [Clostridium sp.]MCM1172802.1 GNAT family N-acetyltransferase [Clostridium sp.]MCM1209707.1 GNAT family N-acetyltransferase [Ruminococcus sp.]
MNQRSAYGEQSEAGGYLLSEIANLEKECFSDAWSEQSIEQTLGKEYNLLVFAGVDKSGNLFEKTIFGGTDFQARLAKIGKNECEFVGYMIANVIGDESELLRIAVVPAKRKMHAGCRLLKKYLKNTNAASYFLEVRAGNIPARGLYEKLGYEAIHVRKGYYQNPVEDAVVYRLKF